MAIKLVSFFYFFNQKGNAYFFSKQSFCGLNAHFQRSIGKLYNYIMSILK